MNKLLRFTRVLPAPAALAVSLEKLLFWDMEPEPIIHKRRSPPPKPLVACTADYSGRRRRTYTPDEFPALHRELWNADAAVSFNGNHFDLKVLAAYLGKSVRALGIESFDLMLAIERACHHRHNLNNLAYVNLGEAKRCLGLKPRTRRQQTLDCHSDVRQLRRLFRLFMQGRLKVPTFASAFTNRAYKSMPFGGQCPVCNDIASINELPHDKPEKELDAAILAGVLGDPEACRSLVGIDVTHRCFTCGAIFPGS